jgi:arabinose-5-phosphate isomerase
MRAEAPPLGAAMEAGRQAIELTRQAVDRLADRFDGAAGPCLELILASTGRLIVTGLGKSGLVGAKVAATFSSTGTPAQFVHAADALHGDAGCLVPGDVLIALSNSGETDEVCTFAELAASRGVPVIAMTGCGGGSRLARTATAVLDVSVEREADPHNLVPTTSTTATLVMGDALALALMAAREFTPADFFKHHPGGALGRRLATGSGETNELGKADGS